MMPDTSERPKIYRDLHAFQYKVVSNFKKEYSGAARDLSNMTCLGTGDLRTDVLFLIHRALCYSTTMRATFDAIDTASLRVARRKR